MTFIPTRRAAANTPAMVGTTARICEVSMPDRANMPLGDPKSFCISMTITAVCASVISAGPDDVSMLMLLAATVIGSVAYGARSGRDLHGAEHIVVRHADPV